VFVELGDLVLAGLGGESFIEPSEHECVLLLLGREVDDALLELSQLRHALVVEVLEVIVLCEPLKVLPNLGGVLFV
jgi:hypothetical protein